MFLFHPIHFVKFFVKSQPQRSYKKGSYIKKRVYIFCASLLVTTSRLKAVLHEAAFRATCLAIGHFRVAFCLFQNESKCEIFHMKMSMICIRMDLWVKLISIWKVSHLDSFWNRGKRQLGNGLFCCDTCCTKNCLVTYPASDISRIFFVATTAAKCRTRF